MTPKPDKEPQAHKISKMFNYIGGTLIFFGITYLIFNNIFLLTTLSRILVTLGIAIWSLFLAVSLSKQNDSPSSSAVFYIIGGVMLPIGIGVTLNATTVSIPYDLQNILISAICLSTFVILQLRFPREILILFCILFGSTFFIACTDFVNDHLYWFSANTLVDYQLFILGLFYFVLGVSASFQENRLTGALYFFGDLLMLVASFQLAGLLFEDRAFVIWQILAPLIVLLSFIFSIPLKSNALLYLAALFLIIYITSLTRQFAYLFGPIGWPIVLIGAGVVLMLLGYLIVSMQKQIPKK